MLPGKQTCCVGQSAHLSYFSFPDVVVSHSYCSGSNVWAAEGMLPRVYSTIDVENRKNVAKTVSISLFLVGSFLAHLQSLSPLAGRWNRLPTAGWGVTCGLTTSIRVSYNVAAPRETGPWEGAQGWYVLGYTLTSPLASGKLWKTTRENVYYRRPQGTKISSWRHDEIARGSWPDNYIRVCLAKRPQWPQESWSPKPVAVDNGFSCCLVLGAIKTCCF